MFFINLPGIEYNAIFLVYLNIDYTQNEAYI